jgi:hypothetical protein
MRASGEVYGFICSCLLGLFMAKMNGALIKEIEFNTLETRPILLRLFLSIHGQRKQNKISDIFLLFFALSLRSF